MIDTSKKGIYETPNIRLAARLDIKGENLIKGIQLEGLRKLGDPKDFAVKYYDQGIDEIIYIDLVASLYGRSKIENLVARTASEVFVPITVGGGIRSLEDVTELLHFGADKVAINSAAVADPKLISEISEAFGSQCVVSSIEAKKCGESQWEVLTHCGREKTGLDAVSWARKVVDLGAGEILLTSVDFDGTEKGFDIELVSTICAAVNVPVIASGGMGTNKNLSSILEVGGLGAIAVASILHYEKSSVTEIKNVMSDLGCNVRV